MAKQTPPSTTPIIISSLPNPLSITFPEPIPETAETIRAIISATDNSDMLHPKCNCHRSKDAGNI